LVRPVAVSYDVSDCPTIPALWYTPLGATGKLPVIVAVMGGPNRQAHLDASPWIQYFLSRGWAVLVPNVRGSSGYGKSYAAADNEDKRAAAISDVTEAGAWLAARKDVDHKRMVVLGEGYGGFLALSALAEAPKLWSAGVCINGFADVIGHMESAPLWKRSLIEAEFGAPGEIREKFSAISPLNRVNEIRVPIFLAGDSGAGMAAFREALLSKNGTVDFLPSASGELCSRDGRIALHTEIEKFLNRHVLKK
jgi:dipeptidyl aminopeptidase/acylaminoacyl peptidase